ncbi:MAG: HK97 gp10 family phage protein [Cetobacterium sp.]
MKDKFETFGFEEIEKELQEIGKSFPNASEKFLKQQANYLNGIVKKKTPYITGALKSGWQVSGIKQGSKRISIRVYNNVVYGADVNYGHRIKRGGKFVGFVKGSFFLESSLKALSKKQEELVKKIFNNITKGMR